MDFSRLRGGQQVRVAKAACTWEMESAGCFLRRFIEVLYLAADSV